MASSPKNTQREAFDAQIRELAGELEKHITNPGSGIEHITEPGSGIGLDTKILKTPVPVVDPEEQQLWEKFQKLMESNKTSVDALAAVVPAQESLMNEIIEQLKRKNALESANEKLFNVLHDELRGYKDSFLFEALQKPVARDLIGLMDDFERLRGQLPEESCVLRNFENIMHHLREILHRMEVVEVEAGNGSLDQRSHKVLSVEQAESPEEDGKIVQIVRQGYRWRDRMLRPQEVVIARWKPAKQEEHLSKTS